MDGKYIIIPTLLVALGAGGAACRRVAAPVAARPVSAREKARSDLAYIISEQRAENSYGKRRKEHPAPAGSIITDGTVMHFDGAKQKTTVGTVVSPVVDGVERIVVWDGAFGLVDTSADGGVDRIVVAAAPYDPRNPHLNPRPKRNLHPREGGFPPNVADAYLHALAAVVAETGKRGGSPTYDSVKRFEAARAAFMAALNPPAPTPSPSP